MSVLSVLGVGLAIAAKDLRLIVRDRPRLAITVAWPLFIAVFFGFVNPEKRAGAPLRLAVAGDGAVVEPWVRAINAQASAVIAEPAPQGQPPAPRLPSGTRDMGAPEPPSYSGWLDVTALGEATLALSDECSRERVLPLVTSAGLTVLSPDAAAKLRVTPRVLDSTHCGAGRGRSLAFPQAIVWALLSLAAKFGAEFAQERDRGTLLRLHVAPLSPTAIVLGKTLACALSMLAMTALLLAVGWCGFGLPSAHPQWLLLGAITSVVAFTGIMAVIGVASRKSAAAANIAWAALMTLAMVGGAMVPMPYLPATAERLALVSPVYWVLTVFEAGLTRALTPAALLGYHGALIATGALGLWLGGRLLSRYEP